MTNWKTTVFGLVAGFLSYLHMSGVTLGHLGHTDFVAIGAAAAVAAAGVVAKDATPASN